MVQYNQDIKPICIIFKYDTDKTNTTDNEKYVQKLR